MKKFIRQDSFRHFKLGRNRRKKKWRRPTGRHSKMRKQRKSYPASPTVGYKRIRKDIGRINNFIPLLINNLKDLERATKDNIIVVSSRLGARKRMEVIKKADEMKLKIFNIWGKIGKNEA